MKLVVVIPFVHEGKSYAKGDSITDPKVVKAVQAHMRSHVVPVNTK